MVDDAEEEPNRFIVGAGVTLLVGLLNRLISDDVVVLEVVVLLAGFGCGGDVGDALDLANELDVLVVDVDDDDNDDEDTRDDDDDDSDDF